MEEIKTELRQDNLAVKANAVAKLTYVSHLCTKQSVSINLCQRDKIDVEAWGIFFRNCCVCVDTPKAYLSLESFQFK